MKSGCLRAENGVIIQFRLYGDYFSNGDISVLENAVKGVKYDYESIVCAAEKAGVSSVLPGVSAGEFAEILGL